MIHTMPEDVLDCCRHCMLEERPGNIILIGNGDTPSVHDPRYDFNDDAIPFGIAYFRYLIERGMPL